MSTGSLGERIAAYRRRRRRGLSQAALAGLVGRSESWLSQVERGAGRLIAFRFFSTWRRFFMLRSKP